MSPDELNDPLALARVVGVLREDENWDEYMTFMHAWWEAYVGASEAVDAAFAEQGITSWPTEGI